MGRRENKLLEGSAGRHALTPVMPQASRKPPTSRLAAQAGCTWSRRALPPGTADTQSQLQHTAQPRTPGCRGLRNSCCFPAWRNSHFRGAETAPTHVHFTFKSSGLRGVSETEGDIIAVKKRLFPSASRKNERHHQHYGSRKMSRQRTANPPGSKIQCLAISTSRTHQHPSLPSALASFPLFPQQVPILPATRTLTCRHSSR